MGAKCDAPITSILPVSRRPHDAGSTPTTATSTRPQTCRPTRQPQAHGTAEHVSGLEKGLPIDSASCWDMHPSGASEPKAWQRQAGESQLFPVSPSRVPAINQSCTLPPLPLPPSIQKQSQVPVVPLPGGFFLAHHPRCPLPGTMHHPFGHASVPAPCAMRGVAGGMGAPQLPFSVSNRQRRQPIV